MPVTKTLPLHSSGAVARVVKYLSNEKAPSHQEYCIAARVGCDHPELVAASIERGVQLLNAERNGSHRISVRAWWVIVRFADQSHLNEQEMEAIEKAVLSGIPVREVVPVAWHINGLTGGCDLNVVVPIVADGPVAQLRRFVGSSLRQRVIQLVDAVTDALNTLRAKAGEALIRTVAHVRAEKAKTSTQPSLEMQLALTATKNSAEITVENLPSLLRSSGYDDEDFFIDDDVLKIRRGKKRLKLQLDNLIMAARSLLGVLQVSLGIEPNVLPSKASTADVRQSAIKLPTPYEKVADIHQPSHP